MKKLTIPQARRIAINRLSKTLEKLKKLPVNKFNYGSFVCEADKEKECGTVCCVAGWYPRWFPAANLVWKYKRRDGDVYLTNLNGRKTATAVRNQLIKYHLLDERVVQTLFFGGAFSVPGNDSDYFSTPDGLSSTKGQVTALFRDVLSALKQKDLDSLLILKK